MLWLWDLKKSNHSDSLTDPVDERINDVLDDPIDEWIDYAIDFLERAAKRLLPWVAGILIGLILGYAWRMAQTGGF